MGAIFTKNFWADTFERSVSTAAQAVLVVAGLSDDFIGVLSQDFNFRLAVSAAVLGFGFTVLKCLAASYVGNSDSPSLIE